MAYIDPSTVLSPKGCVSRVDVICNTGDSGWSAADVIWEGHPRIGIRWNGASGEIKGVGNPQSRGLATWFIVPEELENTIRDMAAKIAAEENAALIQGYREMAADQEREADAKEWIEGMIGDSFNVAW